MVDSSGEEDEDESILVLEEEKDEDFDMDEDEDLELLENEGKPSKYVKVEPEARLTMLWIFSISIF